MLDLKPIDGSGITPRGTGGCGEAGQALSPAPSLFPWQQ